MKKTFRSILAGALALLAVSCYDDSAIQNQLKDHEDRLTSIEATLNAEVGGVNNLVSRIEALEGKIAAINVETKDGVTTLTLSDGNSVVLSKNGALTIVDGGWATVAADGTVTPLGVQVGHKLDFKVENGELMYAAEGENNYEGTGVKISNYTAHVIGNVVTAADGKSVTITVGDQTLELPLVTSAVASLGLSRDSFFLRYGVQKEVEITAENLHDVYVMNEPDGWKASIEGDKLIVTSPSKKAVEADAAHAEGLVLVHATTEEGKCIVAKIEVSTGKGLTIEVDRKGGLTLTNAYLSPTVDEDGAPTYEFAQYYIGYSDASVFLADPVGYIQNLRDTYEVIDGSYGMMQNNYNIEFPMYKEGVCEVEVVKTSVPDIYEWLSWGRELEYGQNKVVWVAPVDSKGSPIVEEVEYISYTYFKYNVEITDITHNAATLNLDVAGATKFYVCLIDAAFEQNGSTLETAVNEGGLWMYLQQPEYLDYWQGMTVGDEATTVDLSTLTDWGDPLNFNNKYYVVVFPYLEGTVYTDFESQFMPYVHTFNTNPLLPGGDYAVTFSDDQVTFTSVATTVTIPENVGSVYHAFYDVETWAALEGKSDEAIVEALFEDCNRPLSYSDVLSEGGLDPASTLVLATLAVGNDGKYGPVVTKSLSTLAIPSEKNEAHTVTMGTPTIEYSKVALDITPAEGVTAYYEFMTESSLSNYSTEAELVAYMVAKSSTTAKKNVSKTYMSAGSSITLVVLAVGADGKYNIYKQSYTTKNYPYDESVVVTLDNMTWDASSKTVKATFSVSGASKLAVATGYENGLSSFVSNVVSYAATGSYSNYKFVDVVDGKVSVEFTKLYGDYMAVFAAAYKVQDNAVSAISKNSLELVISKNAVAAE